MSYATLGKRSLQQDEDLANFINNKPTYTKTVTIAPNEELWNRFERHVKNKVGSKKVSRMVNYLVWKWMEDAEPEPITEWDSDDAIVKTLSVDHKVWNDFMTKLREMYSKHKIQSDILNNILKEYLGQ